MTSGRLGRSGWLRVALLALAGLTLAADASAWWNTSWSHRRKLTLNNTSGAAHAGFPVLIVLDNLNVRIDYSKTRNAGEDLRFVDADDTTPLAYEIEKWDEAGNSYVWVRVPQVDASNTDFIWMYYGNPTIGDGQNPTGVWDADFKLVHHLKETAGAHVDSTSNPNDSVVVDVAAQGSAAGRINGTDSFSTAGCVPSAATCDNIDIADNATLDVGAAESLTVEAWIRTPTAGAFQHIAVKEAPGGVGTGFDFLVWSSDQARFGVTNSGLVPTNVSVMGGSVADNAWHYVVGRWTRSTSTADIFVDGVVAGTASNGVYAASPMSNTQPFRIGERGDSDAGGFNFNGTIDEVRFSKAATPRSDNWIAAQYDSMRDTGVGLVGPFVTYGLEAAHCCGLGVTEPGDGTITVNGPNRFDLRFNTATGGGIDRLIDAEEDTGVDMAGAIGTYPDSLIASSLRVGGLFYNSAFDTQARLELLEATPARARVRQSGRLIRAGVPLAGVVQDIDSTIYGVGKTVHSLRRRTSAVVIHTGAFLDVNLHLTATGPLSTWTGSSQSDATFPNPGTDGFLLAKNDSPGGRTDVLTVLHRDWSLANGYTSAATAASYESDLPNEWLNPAWDDNTGATVPAGSDERWDLLIDIKPTTLGIGASPWLDPAVTSRSTDYRVPSATTVGPGAGWIDANENTASDPANVFFNEAEAAYVFDLDPATGLTLAMDGSTTTRYDPFLKIRRWQSFVEAPVVTFDPDGGGPTPAAALAKNTSYRASVKPVARAHFAQDLLWYSSMESSAAVTAPFVGNGTGTVETGMSYAAGRYGNGAVFNAATDEIKLVLQPGVGLANIELDRGRIEFWYQPNYAHTDNAEHYLFDIDADGVNGNSRIRMKKESNVSCGGCPNALTAEVSDATGTFRGVTILNANYTWRAGEWIHLALEWDSFDATDNVRAYLNGVQLAPQAVANGIFTMEAETAAGILRIGNKAVGPGFWNADGMIDEFRIYSAAPQEIAHGGLTSDAREYLADSSDNFPLALQPVDSSGRGRYLFFGFDSKPKGLNVNLATPGAGVADNQVQWFFWNGTAWQFVFPADGTNSFKKTGTIWWNPDWPGWTPYSLSGGPDLYYMMARLQGVSGYTITPVERVIKTDILLFEYCRDVTTAAATFAFAVPPTTEVTLSSFSATPSDRSVLLQWRTGSELQNLGFHLYRALAQSGPWARLNASLIAGLGSSAVGQSYSFRDTGLVNGTRYFYRLDDVDASSKTTSHGPVSAVPLAGAPGGAPGSDAPSSSGASTKKKTASSSACPDWVVAAYESLAGSASSAELSCSRHGDPEAVSLGVVSRDARQATLELKTGGFYALHTQPGAGEPAGAVRVFVPGFDFPQDEKAAALPIRRALADAVVGRRVQLGGVRALEVVSFKGLVPSALGKAEMQVGRDGTVRPSRRAAGHGETRAARLFPRVELVTLLPSVFQGEAKSAVVQIAPLRFDAQRGLVLAKRVRVKLLFTGRETGESGRGSLGRAPGSRKPVSGELLARLYTTSRGLYSAPFEQLFPGAQRGFAASQLRLERQGEPVGFHLEPSADAFGPGGRIYFFADRATASTDFSAEVAYELVRSRDGLQLPLQSAAPGSNALTSTSLVSRSFETNRFYQPGLLDAPDPWLWEALASGATRAKSFSLSGVDSAASATAELEVFLQGASESGEAVDHHLSVSLNGTLVGNAQFAGKRPYRMGLSVPASLLREGANELSLTNVADTGVSSFVFLDRFGLLHPQLPSLTNGVFEGTWAQAGTASLVGVSGPVVVLDVTAARWLTGFASAGGSLRFHAEAGHRHLAVSQQALLTPRVAAAAASTLRSTQNQADYLLITPRAFLGVAEPLVQRRADQGLTARTVSFEEIADEFGHGQPSAEAIRAFLAHAFQSWTRPSPRYVLLLGDSTYDPRNFIGTSQPSPLPALWSKTSYLWTVSDPQLAAVNGEDALPDLAIGRLPAATVEQAQALVAKLLAWEDSGQGLSGRAALVADNPDMAGDFEADVRDIAQSYLASRNPQLLLMNELGPEMRPRILDALDSGLSFLSYVGHGGAAVWASENVWNSWDAASLQAQSQQPFLVTMNCLNGYFVAPAFDSLSESLLKAEGRGAIASFSPSGLSLDGPAHQYHRALMAELTTGRHQRLGDAILAAQKTYADMGLMPELISVYHLLGDPALRIR